MTWEWDCVCRRVNQRQSGVMRMCSSAVMMSCDWSSLWCVFDLVPAAYIQTCRALMVAAFLLGLPSALMALLATPCVRLGDESDGTKRKRAVFAGILALIMCEWRVISYLYIIYLYQIINDPQSSCLSSSSSLCGVLSVLMCGSYGFSRFLLPPQTMPVARRLATLNSPRCKSHSSQYRPVNHHGWNEALTLLYSELEIKAHRNDVTSLWSPRIKQ